MNLGGIFDLNSQESKLESLRKESLDPAFWNNKDNASNILRSIGRLENNIKIWADLEKRHGDITVLFEFAESGEVEEKEIIDELNQYEKIINDLELKLILGDNQDIQDAILTIHPGAGGTESQDWADMLFRMYSRYIERKSFNKMILDYQPGDEAGIKDITMEIKGDYAYGMLKAEAGIHRLVRISPFDSNSRRHTSFASVFVYPSVSEEIDIEINPNDLRIDTYRASGAGGQHVNKTDSAVRITHLPTKIVVQCQNSRSQHKNKATALSMLRARIYELKLQKKEVEEQSKNETKLEIGWGRQIRSYVMHPYKMVKDLRNNVETPNCQSVLDGNIDFFLEAALFRKNKKK
mgnify:CR=1 FL=1